MVITSLNRPLLQKIPSWVLWIVVWINMLIDITCECDLYFYTFKCISLCCIMETAALRNRMRAVRGGEATRTSLFTGVLHWHLGLWPAHPEELKKKNKTQRPHQKPGKKQVLLQELSDTNSSIITNIHYWWLWHQILPALWSGSGGFHDLNESECVLVLIRG